MRYSILFCLLLSLISCNKLYEWTEKERQDFKTKCSQTIYFIPDPISFTGFEFDEIDSIKVIEKSNLKKISTFFIYLDKENNLNRPEYKTYWTHIEKNLNVNHSYEFYLGKDKPYILNNMEMIMWAQYTMKGEGWGCEMGNFTIDNQKFEHVGNINFTKRGFKLQ
ncbi:hypothetical protein [Flavobacterium sp. LC2016-01]|uniref:hypothetical protein n=1 Tax=Flavobacterium sp. LC2016-01 TaxID=2675876 RepID=UPI0012BA687D|nr:hypothetical protein [Flavobacterium sp. LC2016-01]MTH15596.1 hypothetical protein [Flavobacterium sp. LC2016-01]